MSAMTRPCPPVPTITSGSLWEIDIWSHEVGFRMYLAALPIAVQFCRISCDTHFSASRGSDQYARIPQPAWDCTTHVPAAWPSVGEIPPQRCHGAGDQQRTLGT